MDLTGLERAASGALALSRGEQARAACRVAQALEETGRYEEAREALADFWPGLGLRPDVEGLDGRDAAALFLRAGTLTGWLGSSLQLGDAQEAAKDLLTEAHARFESAGDARGAAETLIELSYCYWRQGATGEARVALAAGGALVAHGDTELRAVAALRGALIEESETRFHEALRVLTEAAPLFDSPVGDALKGKYHNELAAVYWFLGESGRREEYTDRALVEYTAASYHFEQAGHMAYRAAVENNLGCLFLSAGRLADAHRHLDCARGLFVRLNDRAHTAQVDETRSRVLLAEGRAVEAERVARASARALAGGGEQAVLAEALTTQGVALARLGRGREARAVFGRASEVAERAGNLEGAGLAELSLLEELCDELAPREARELYESADRLLARTESQKTLTRLRAVAIRLIKSAAADAEAAVAAGGPEVAGARGPEVARAAEPEVARTGADEPESFIRGACERFGKRVEFEPAAVEAMRALLLRRGAGELRAAVERTVERAEAGATVGARAVETLALRHDPRGADFIEPWAGFSFREEIKRYEENLIERALDDADGSVSRAARLLGFRHHESLNWRLKNRNKSLLPARTPAKRRRRSIIGKEK